MASSKKTASKRTAAQKTTSASKRTSKPAASTIDASANPNEALYRALEGGAVSVSDLRKATGWDDAELSNMIATAKSRLWIEADESGKEPTVSLTEFGRGTLASRYAQPVG